MLIQENEKEKMKLIFESKINSDLMVFKIDNLKNEKQ